MKAILQLCVFCMLLVLTSCDKQDVILNQKEHLSQKSTNIHSISKNEAIDIANKFISSSIKTRSSSLTDVSIECVTTENSSINQDMIDTVAYVINYPEEEGFVIVSSDKRTPPILAYSETGNFTLQNDVAKECFIDKLDFYIQKSKSNTLLESEYDNMDHICYVSGTGHAWVIDGCDYCVSMEDNTQIMNTYFHCDWGWGGACNGYYSGNVFELDDGDSYRPSSYFAVKREWQD